MDANAATHMSPTATPRLGLGTWIAATVSGLLFGLMWLRAPAWSASASALVDGAGGGAGWAALLGRAIGKGGSPTGLRVIWACVATANGAGIVLLARLAGAGRLAWGMAALCALMSSDTFFVVGIEGPFLLTTIMILLAGHLAPRSPGLAAPLLAMALVITPLLAPIGLLISAPLAIIAALFPRPSAESSQGVASRPVAIAWLAGLIGALALIRLALPEDTAAAWWSASISALRSPTPRLLVGGWAEWRGVGGLLAGLGLLPAIPLMLALWTLRPTVTEDEPTRTPRSGVLAAAAAWWVTIGFSYETTVIDTAALVSPFLLIAAAAEARRWVDAILVRHGRLFAIGLGCALLFATVADRATGADPRSGLGRAMIGLDDPTALQPAVLRTSELDLLHKFNAPARILPDRAGSRPLIEALRKLKVVRAGVREWDAFAAQYVLIHEPPVGPIAKGWKASLPAIECTGDVCLLRIADGKQQPQRAARP